MRKHFIDNMRWVTVLLVAVYHLFMMFCTVVPLGAGSFAAVQPQDAVLYLLYPWFMVLLFVTAGAASYYALQRCTGREYLRSRTRRLLVPSTVGLLAFQWILGLMSMQMSGAFDTIRETVPESARPVVYAFSAVLSGIGPLWIIQMLWIFSVLLLLLRKADRQERLHALGGRVNFPVLLLMMLPIWGAAQILNTPVITVYRFGIYGLAFFLGYTVFSHDSVHETLAKYHAPLCVASAVLAAVFTVRYFGENFAEQQILCKPLTNAFAWVTVLAVFGLFRARFDRTNAFASYMTKHSWGLYVLHYLPLSAAAYLCKRVWALPAVPCYLLTALCEFGGAWLLYQIIRRIPVLRWCVLGIRKADSAAR